MIETEATGTRDAHPDDTTITCLPACAITGQTIISSEVAMTTKLFSGRKMTLQTLNGCSEPIDWIQPTAKTNRGLRHRMCIRYGKKERGERTREAVKKRELQITGEG